MNDRSGEWQSAVLYAHARRLRLPLPPRSGAETFAPRHAYTRASRSLAGKCAVRDDVLQQAQVLDFAACDQNYGDEREVGPEGAEAHKRLITAQLLDNHDRTSGKDSGALESSPIAHRDDHSSGGES